jgi:Holliday junction DNA helicase RuvB
MESANMDSIIGHINTKKQLAIAVESAVQQNKSIPHILFSGTAGCGKTTMAMEVAKLAGVDFIPVSPDDLSNKETVMGVLDSLNHSGYDQMGNRVDTIKPSMVFVDEIHRIPRKGQEILGIAMEKFILESGRANKFYWIPYFTLVGATTDDGELSKPFIEKFKLRFLFNTYSDEEITSIINSHAVRKGIPVTQKAARAISRRSRGIPRTAVGFLERCQDYAYYKSAQVITFALVEKNFDTMKIDAKGLTPTEITVLKTLYESNGPIGLDNLAIITNEARKNLLHTIEPFLIRLGFMIRSGKGRVITEKGKQYIDSNYSSKDKFMKVEIEPNYVRK